jgi:beta-mannosidase
MSRSLEKPGFSTRSAYLSLRNSFHFYMRCVVLLILLRLLAPAEKCRAESWTVRVEEPTGLYPRTNEIVTVPLTKLAGLKGPWIVADTNGTELPWQATADALLFPATLIPGELPEYRVRQVPRGDTNFVNGILLRKLGINRVELGNRHFRVLIDLQAAAIVEAYNLRADSHRTLNLVETTPEEREALKDDIHAAEAMGIKPVPGVPLGNTGWTSLGGSGPLTRVEIIENGPLRGKMRLGRSNETWELQWTSDSPVLVWRALKGFRFTAISALPYLPFDRCVDGSEYEWPSGPDDSEPPDHDIQPRKWPALPGGHVVYYHHAENYGALGIISPGTNLTWTGIGSRRFIGEGPDAPSAVAISFPLWSGTNTVLQARREYRVWAQPLLIEVSKATDKAELIQHPAQRNLEAQIQSITPTPNRSADPNRAADVVVDVPAPYVPEAVSLDGDWELAWCEKGQGPPVTGWRTVRVPGTAHVQWLPPAQIYTRNAEWISGKEWWYRRHFEVPAGWAGKRVLLKFGATDYYADTWLNGQRLGRHEGYIDPYEFDISTSAFRDKSNELLVRTWAPVNYYWKHRSYTIKGAYGAVDQKPDDITPVGITRSVQLVCADDLRLQDIAVDTRLSDDGTATVEVNVELERAPANTATLELTLSPRNFSAGEIVKGTLVISNKNAKIVLPVMNPQLWWTWDHGKPNLYTLDVRLRNESGGVQDGRTLAVGIREIERIGWTFYLNRRRMFIRGTNYYYHLFLSEMNRAAYQRDLGLMQQMNANLIRLHCHFSNPEFYDVADELGILVWQDFLEAWYPEDRAFSLRAATLYDPLIRYVRNHACVATWTTCDEESLENYRDLTKHLAPRPALLDPQRRPIVRSTGRFGDAHVYHGWYDGSLWEYTNMTEPFVSELGATCLPNYSTLIKFMPNGWPIRDHADDWFFRRLQIPEALRAWGEPGNMTLQEYIPRTQAYVSRLFQIALERSRRLKYQPAGGICHFHSIDIWPSVTMAAIDFERVPTQVFYTVQRSFAPVCASLEYDRDTWKPGEHFRCGVWAINDRWEPVPNASVHWRITDTHKVELASGQWPVSMSEDSVLKLGEAEWTAAGSGDHELHAEVRDQSGSLVSENVFAFKVTN